MECFGDSLHRREKKNYYGMYRKHVALMLFSDLLTFNIMSSSSAEGPDSKAQQAALVSYHEWVILKNLCVMLHSSTCRLVPLLWSSSKSRAKAASVKAPPAGKRLLQRGERSDSD